MVRLIHEVLMEGNCYSWLCRLMSTVSFSQHHALKIREGQGTLGTLPSPHGPEIRVALSIPSPASVLLCGVWGRPHTGREQDLETNHRFPEVLALWCP